MSESERVILTTEGRDYPGTVRHRYGDGLAYVVLDSGSQGNFPEDRLRPLEDKDAPRAGLETK